MASNDFVTHRALPPVLMDKLPLGGSPTLKAKLQSIPLQPHVHYRKCEILPSMSEWEFVWSCFLPQKPEGLGIKRIWYVQNENQLELFKASLPASECEAEKFIPDWDNTDFQRQKVYRRWKQATDPYSPFEVPGKGVYKNVKILPLWHGTDQERCHSICESGFIIYGKQDKIARNKTAGDLSTDVGYFGSGIYFTPSADYAARYYARGCLLLALVSMREPYPVIAEEPYRLDVNPKTNQRSKDMRLLEGRGAYRKYDTHYIPVVSINPGNRRFAIYYPCAPGQAPDYDEYVVFQRSQTCVQFIVELQADLPTMPSSGPLLCAELLDTIFKALNQETIRKHSGLYQALAQKTEVLLILNDPGFLPPDELAFAEQLRALLATTEAMDTLVVNTLMATVAATLPLRPSMLPPLEKIQKDLKIQDFQEAYRGLIFLISTLKEDASSTLILQIYDSLRQILPHLPLSEKPLLFNKIIFPLLRFEQPPKKALELAWNLAKWFISKKETVSKDQRLDTVYLPSLTYYTQAIEIAERQGFEELKVLYVEGSRIFFYLIQQDLKELGFWMDHAIKEKDLLQFEQALLQLSLIQRHFCQTPSENECLDSIYRKARNFFITLENPPSTLQPLIEAGFSSSPPAPPAIKGYRERLRVFQEETKTLFATLNHSNVSETNENLNKLYKKWFCGLVTESQGFILGALPPYEWGLIGDLGKQEPLPQSVIEWVLVGEQHPALMRWANGLKLLMTSLSDSAENGKHIAPEDLEVADFVSLVGTASFAHNRKKARVQLEQYRQLLQYPFGKEECLDVEISLRQPLHQLVHWVSNSARTPLADSTLSQLLQDLFVIQTRLQLDNKSGSISLNEDLSQEERNRLEKVYWLGIRPLCFFLERAVTETRMLMKPLCLAEAAIDEVTWSEISGESFRMIEVVVNNLVDGNVDRTTHETLYTKLSRKSALEPLRRLYLDTLKNRTGTAALIAHLALIPNVSGFRQSIRIEEEKLIEDVRAITQAEPPLNFPKVALHYPDWESPRYLKPEIATTILNEEGNIRKHYSNSLHAVAPIEDENIALHVKEQPNHPMQEYAVYSLTARLCGKGVPPSALFRCVVELAGKTKNYPVSISQTIVGKNLKDILQADPNYEFNAKQLSQMQLMDIVKLPGDGRASNFIVTTDGKVFSVDNDVSFVFPVQKYLFRTTVPFCSILFCLKPQSIDSDVLKEWAQFSVEELINEWIHALIAKELKYLSLFTVQERKELFNKNKELAFTPTLILKAGTVTTLYTQLLFLQQLALDTSKIYFPLDLLSLILTLRAADKGVDRIGPYIERAYTQAYKRGKTPEARLGLVTSRNIDKSMTTRQALVAHTGYMPTAEQIESREEYSLEKLYQEFLAYSFTRLGGTISSNNQGDETLFIDFSKVNKNGVPDSERQELMLLGIQKILTFRGKKVSSLTLWHCAVLTPMHLKFFLWPGLKYLDLRYSSIEFIDQDIEVCTELRELNLSGCPNLHSIKPTSTFALLTEEKTLLLPALESLQIADCPQLKHLSLDLPNLKTCKATYTPQLYRPKLETNLTAHIEGDLLTKNTILEVFKVPFMTVKILLSLLLFIEKKLANLNIVNLDMLKKTFGWQVLIQLQLAQSQEGIKYLSLRSSIIKLKCVLQLRGEVISEESFAKLPYQFWKKADLSAVLNNINDCSGINDYSSKSFFKPTNYDRSRNMDSVNLFNMLPYLKEVKHFVFQHLFDNQLVLNSFTKNLPKSNIRKIIICHIFSKSLISIFEILPQTKVTEITIEHCDWDENCVQFLIKILPKTMVNKIQTPFESNMLENFCKENRIDCRVLWRVILK